MNSVRVNWDGEPAVLTCLRDISRIKDLENRLSRAEKMELIGTMAGGVAYDLNNILAGLVSYPELMLMHLPQDSPLKEPIHYMLDSGLKAAEIVQDLLTLTRRGVPSENITNLNNVLHEYLTSPVHQRLEKDYPEIEFVSDCEADLLNICGSASHISKIIMNLVMNAAEAISNAGQVKMETLNRYIDMPLSRYDSIEEGDYAVLRVSDNGHGISPEDLERIFDPFFTNKQMGKSGSGLGLSVVWNCIKDHNGYVEVSSQLNHGTVFEIYFPVTRRPATENQETFNISDFKGSGQHILIVDDIPAQREIATHALQVLGYQSHAVSSGEDAIEYVTGDAVDLILLDMKLGAGMDGYDSYRRILTVRPGQKAIIASGFSINDRVQMALDLGAGQYIQKPYTLKKLAVCLKEELSKTD